MVRLAMIPLLSRVVIMAIVLFGILGLAALLVGKINHRDIIAFLSAPDGLRRIYVMDSEHGISLKAEDAPIVTNFAFSPDGGQIAFSTATLLAAGLTNAQVYIRDLFGAPERLMTEFTGSITSALAWSPDGTQVAYSASHSAPIAGIAADTSDIYLMDAGSGRQEQLTRLQGWNINPAWSVDGQHLIFFSATQGNGVDMYAVDVHDPKPQKLAVETMASSQVSWSPDGAQMAFMRINEDAAELSVGDSGGSHLRTLTHHAIGDFMPVWSPDGSRIAFQSYHTNQHDIYVINEDGSGLQQVVSGSYPILGPVAWSPDSRKIAYAADLLGSGKDSIIVVNVDGSGEQILTSSLVASRSPIWMPR